MRIFQIAILVFFLSFSSVLASEDWGRNGHRATAEIAQKHLSNKATKQIKKLLEGASLALVSTYADEIKSDNAYRAYGPWHYVNFPFGGMYEASEKNTKGDIIVAINTCVEILKSKTSTSEEKAFHLKLLVHFIGDLHQPLHIGIAEDKGANDFQVRWFDEGTNLHSVWDTKMIESYEMSYSELATNDSSFSKEEIVGIKSGSVTDWMYESRSLCEKIYKTTNKGDKLGYNYMYDYVPIVRQQLEKGGIRLATVLNEIFG